MQYVAKFCHVIGVQGHLFQLNHTIHRTTIKRAPNVKDHRAGGIKCYEAVLTLIAGSGASPCWAGLPLLSRFLYSSKRLYFDRIIRSRFKQQE